MDIVTAGRACLRRWYLFIPIIIIGVLATQHYAKQTKPTYQATASFIVIGSSEQTVKPTPTATRSAPVRVKGSATPTPTPTARPTPQITETAVNPFTGAQDQLRGTLVAQMNASPFQKALQDAGYKGTLVVGGKKKSSLYDITATARRQKPAVDLANAALARANDQIHQIQRSAGAPADTFVNVQTVTTATNAADITSGKSKRVVAGVVITAAAAIALSIALDSLVLTLRRRRAARAAAAPVADAPAPAEDQDGRLLPMDAESTDSVAPAGSEALPQPPVDDSEPISRLSRRRSKSSS